MPPTNAGRTVGAEARVARRVTALRKCHGWTRSQLADEMTRAGCPMDQSAIWKTESAGRRIVVDELLAYCDVFGLSVSRMVGEESFGIDLPVHTVVIA